MSNIALKSLLSVVIIGFVLLQIDTEALVGKLRALAPLHITLAAAFYLMVLPLQAWRLTAIIRRHKPIPLAAVTRIVWIGGFFGQVLPSTIAGDAFRIWYLRKYDISAGVSINAVLVDRIYGIVSLLAILPVSIIWLSSRAVDPRILWLTTGLAGTISAGLLALLFVDRSGIFNWLQHFGWSRLADLRLSMPALRQHFRANPYTLGLLVLSILSQAFYIAAAWQLGHALGQTLEYIPLLLVFPLTMLAGFLPISVGGWGVREAILVAMSGIMGITAEDAFALSILTGLLVTLISLPGLPLWWFMKR